MIRVHVRNVEGPPVHAIKWLRVFGALHELAESSVGPKVIVDGGNSGEGLLSVAGEQRGGVGICRQSNEGH